MNKKWISEPEIVDFANILVFNAPKIKIDYTKHFQILINIDELIVNQNICLLIYRLYCFDKVRHSNHQVKNKLVLYFQGKQSICDNLLLRILKSIESQLNESWCSEINVWTLRNSSLLSEQMFIDENLPLIVKGETGQELTLDIRVILETVKKVKIGMQFKFPPDDASYHEWQKSLCEYTLYYENPSIYNDDFLMFVLISCPEIFKEDGTINLKLLVESGGLSFMICCSASPISDLSRSASTVVHSVLSFIDREEAPSYRENTTISILLSKIRFYFLENPIKEIAPSVFIFLGQLLLVLINPGHHLYERAVDYLLAGPGLRQEIPMIKYIMNTASKDSYRDIQWGLETLINALNTKYDLNLYEKSGIYEWVMTLSLSPYFKKSVIKSQIEQLLEKTTMVPGGSFALMTRHAGLAWNSSSPHTPRHNKEQKLCYLFTAPKEKINGWTDHTLNDIF